MPKKRFNDEQIAFALRQADAGTTVGDICRKIGIAEATFYRRTKVYAGMGVSEIRRLKRLEDENGKLKRLVTDVMFHKTLLQDALRKNVMYGPLCRCRVLRWRRLGFRKCIRPPASGPVFRPGHDEIRTVGFQIAGSGAKLAFELDLPNTDRSFRHHLEPSNPFRSDRKSADVKRQEPLVAAGRRLHQVFQSQGLSSGAGRPHRHRRCF